jgi:hypothetical protein
MWKNYVGKIDGIEEFFNIKQQSDNNLRFLLRAFFVFQLIHKISSEFQTIEETDKLIWELNKEKSSVFGGEFSGIFGSSYVENCVTLCGSFQSRYGKLDCEKIALFFSNVQDAEIYLNITEGFANGDGFVKNVLGSPICAISRINARGSCKFIAKSKLSGEQSLLLV